MVRPVYADSLEPSVYADTLDTSIQTLTQSTYADVKALSHLDDLANVCRRMKNLSKTLAHVKYVMGKFCIR